MIQALNLAKEIRDEITNWRRSLHKMPELGLFLP